MQNKKIVLLAGKGSSTNIVFHALNKSFNIHTVIIEEKEDKMLFIKRRIKRQGIITVAGQIMFQILIVPLLVFFSKRTISRYMEENDLIDKDIPTDKILEVVSVNSASVSDALTVIEPDVVVVNGTRIISKRILTSIKCPIINTHAGITPIYRGVHGAYWALVNKDVEHCGVTVHLVDAGIDTGNVLYQSMIFVNQSDNFVTYPVKQLALAIPLLKQAVENALNGNIKIQKAEGKSGLWYHPTLWKYLYHLIFHKVK